MVLTSVERHRWDPSRGKNNVRNLTILKYRSWRVSVQYIKASENAKSGPKVGLESKNLIVGTRGESTFVVKIDLSVLQYDGTTFVKN